ncbi:uncharacterized protein LOC125499493 isoform X2 [Beta vulgaris subsp. vulgaris]|uniref:uncharacterized protein LOC125499493 isoform X2 n=1 Tax=Beta vulgaris subsp. vulgaris TaxID=3555 RepID=UPI0025470B5F|nr:uncharacterized protein LOC125499493 isoform X2 [Beta vulgaris subsp. vulgaris]
MSKKQKVSEFDDVHVSDDNEESSTEDLHSDGEREVGKKSGRAYKEIEARVYRENDLSKGGCLKAEGKVIATQRARNNKRESNMNCRVETFGKVVKGFDERKRKLVMEMGFGGLLFFAGKSLPKTFCYWLCTRVDVKNRVLLMPDWA